MSPPPTPPGRGAIGPMLLARSLLGDSYILTMRESVCFAANEWIERQRRRTPLWLAVYRPMAHRSAAVAMKKYWHVINIGIQNTLVYRVNFLFRATFALIPLAAVLFLWRAIYAGKQGGGEVAGYTLAQMTSYYLLVTIVDALTAVNEDDWQIAADIREGAISQFLLKPVDYLWYRLCLFFAGRAAYISMACIPLAIFIFIFRNSMSLELEHENREPILQRY